MSFFSKMTKEFEGMMKKDEKKDESPAPTGEATRGYGDQPQYGGYGQAPPLQNYGAPPPQFNSHPSYNSPPPNQYSPAPSGGYGAPPPQQYGSPAPGQYGVPPPASYGSPAPQQYGTAGGLPPTPQVPQGWQALWDPVGNRWAYLEQWNSKVNWNVPTGPSYPQQGCDSHDASRGVGGYPGGAGSYGAPGYQQGGYQQGGYQDPAKEKSDAKKNMMMGAAAGVAVGAVGGVLLANALDDDDNHGGQQQYQSQPPGIGDGELPDETRSGSSVSSSDREEVEEARQEYEEAYEEAYGSD